MVAKAPERKHCCEDSMEHIQKSIINYRTDSYCCFEANPEIVSELHRITLRQFDIGLSGAATANTSLCVFLRWGVGDTKPIK